MKIFRLFSAIFLSAVIASCGKTSDAVKPTEPTTPGKPTTTTTNDVYMVGTVNNTAILWKNGAANKLTASSSRTYASSVYVNGSDIYVAGYGTDQNNGNGVAIIWKNGVATTLTADNPDAQAVSVYASSGTVYAAGYTTVKYQNNQDYPNNGILTYHAATIWVNGTPTILSDGNKAFFDNNGIIQHGQNTNRDSGATGIYANGSDIYVSGWEDYGAYGQINAILWKNKNKLILYNPIGGNYTSNQPVDGFLGKFFTGDTTYVIAPNFSLSSINNASSVFASNGVVYTAGYVTQGAQNGGIQVNAPHRATVWTNGIEKALGDSSLFANPNSIYVSGGNVYIVGFVIKAGKYIATLWKNGVASYLGDLTLNTVATSVFVLGSDVYVVGSETSTTPGKGVLWKNGVATEFSDATNGITISSVFVK